MLPSAEYTLQGHKLFYFQMRSGISVPTTIQETENVQYSDVFSVSFVSCYVNVCRSGSKKPYYQQKTVENIQEYMPVGFAVDLQYLRVCVNLFHDSPTRFLLHIV